jgi:hypothetical protein
MKNRLLAISHCGCGPPFAGNRARVRSLFSVIRELGWEIHFADVLMPDDELQGTLPFVDQHVCRFESQPGDVSLLSRVRRRLRRWSQRGTQVSEAERSVDQWFLPHWDWQAKELQAKYNYDVVLVEYVFHSRFLKAFGPECLKILDTHDRFGNRDARLAAQGATGSWFDTTEDGEQLGLLRADCVIAIQDSEREYFEALLCGQRVVSTVGHFCDVHPLPLPQDLSRIGILASENPLNVDGLKWFLSRVWPIIVAQRPDARLLIGGTISKLTWEGVNVEVLGVVDQVDNFYSRCALTINPMRAGTGLKIKTIEALAHGRVVVGTSVAFEGLADVELKDNISDDQERFAAILVNYLCVPEKLRKESSRASGVVNGLNELWLDNLQRVLRKLY